MNEFSTHVRVLTVGPHDNDLAVLCRILSHSAWTVLSVRTVAEARELLEREHVNVVLAERQMPDGDWRNILELTAKMTEPAQVIVISREGDERLWAEVLNLGAWDLLLQPYHPKEVFRTIHAAWQHGAASNHRPRIPAPKRVASEASTQPLMAAATIR